MSRLTSPLSIPWSLSWWGDRRPAAVAAVGPAGEVRLAAGATAAFDPAAGLRLRCAAGSVWVTQAGEGRDFLLAAGDCFVAAPRGKVVAQALAAARLSVGRVPPVRARVCPGRPA